MIHMLLACMDVRELRPDLAEAVFAGNLRGYLAATQESPRAQREGPPEAQAWLGRLAGRVLLLLGRADEAEEVFQRQLHVYASRPRTQARWLAALDRGVMSLHLRRPAHAASHFVDLANSSAAPPHWRMESLVGLACAFAQLGDHRSAQGALGLAETLVSSMQDPLMEQLLTFTRLNMQARHAIRSLLGEVDSIRSITMQQFPAVQELSAAQASGAIAMCTDRLRLLASLHSDSLEGAAAGRARVEVREALGRLAAAGLRGVERSARLDAAIAFLAQGHHDGAREWLTPVLDEQGRWQHEPDGTELLWCQSQLLSLLGRHTEALRHYQLYTKEALLHLRAELSAMPNVPWLQKARTVGPTHPLELKLPVRYRRAYRYVMENLSDPTLSVNDVAAHVDVTLRALQSAFRLHLGMTPAEFIRHRRMEAIRAELAQGDGCQRVLDVASRWGVHSRSTLTQNYRQCFGEAPSFTLRSPRG